MNKVKDRFHIINFYSERLNAICREVVEDYKFDLKVKVAGVINDRETKDKYFRIEIESYKGIHQNSRNMNAIYGTMYTQDIGVWEISFVFRKDEQCGQKEMKDKVTQLFMEFTLLDTTSEMRTFENNLKKECGWNSEIDNAIYNYSLARRYSSGGHGLDWRISFSDEIGDPQGYNQKYNPNSPKKYKQEMYKYGTKKR